MRRLLCLFGIHSRSRRHARVGQAKVTSVCRHCRKPMEKLQGRWRIAGALEDESEQAGHVS